MSEQTVKRLGALHQSLHQSGLPEQSGLLTFNRGIEREALRVTTSGLLARSPHPEFLGSKLTHPLVTTDFSESQLELITPVHTSPEDALGQLRDIHRLIYSELADELLWSASMPCILHAGGSLLADGSLQAEGSLSADGSLLAEGSLLADGSLQAEGSIKDAAIPLADFGSSNAGRLKTTYRNGLGYRYGRAMQTICAVHYNFSFQDEFWHWLKAFEQAGESLQDFRTRRYFDLMRNFRRYSWLPVYLFGASPAVGNSFVQGRHHGLQLLGKSTSDEQTWHLPFATSLRNSNLGYQSDIQANLLNICYNSLDTYIDSLAEAICAEYAGYGEIGTLVDGEYRQINANVLQSEAEYYSTIRAKRVAGPGENLLHCLADKGVQYLEVRLLDVNPYLPTGMDETEIRFLDTLLTYCLLSSSPVHDAVLCDAVQANLIATVHEGRKPGLTLSDRGKKRTLTSWGHEIMAELRPIADLLDQYHGGSDFAASLDAQSRKLHDAALTPSGAMLNDLTGAQTSFSGFALAQALAHRACFRAEPLSSAEAAAYRQVAQASREAQRALEARAEPSFDDISPPCSRVTGSCCADTSP